MDKPYSPEPGAARGDVRYASFHLDRLALDGRVRVMQSTLPEIPTSSKAVRLADLVHPDDREPLVAHLRAQLDEGEVAACEHRLITGGGRTKQVICMLRPGAAAGDGYQGAVADAESVAAMRGDLRPFLEAMPCGVARYRFLLSPGGNPQMHGMCYANGKYYALLGHTEESFLRDAHGLMRNVMQGVQQSDFFKTMLATLRDPGQPLQTYCLVTRPGGERAYLLGTIISRPEGNGGWYEVICTFQDVTPLYETQAALESQAERIRYLVEATGERFLEYDVQADRLAVLSAQGREGSEDISIDDFLLEGVMARYVRREDLPAVRQALQEAAKTPTLGNIEIRVRTGEGTAWRRIYYTSVVDADQRVTRIVGREMNIDAEKREELALREQAERDALTGIYSRGAAQMLIERFLESEQGKHSTRRHAVFMIDLDNFKQVNDCFGHAVGDSVLKEIAGIIQRSFRTSDVVGRLGGDEFIVLMRRYRDVDAIEQVAQRICTGIKARYADVYGDLDLSASVGIACYPDHGATLAELYRHADIANYEAKAKGKNQWLIYAGGASLQYDGSRRRGDWGKDGSLRESTSQALLDTLHATDDTGQAVRAALEKLARAMGAQRAYIVELDEMGNAYRNGQYGWCAEGFAAQVPAFADVPKDMARAFFTTFDEQDIRAVVDMAQLPAPLRAQYEALGVKSMLHYAIRRDGRVCGYLGLDDCLRAARTVTRWHLEELEAISRMLLLFVQQGMTPPEVIQRVSDTGLLDGMDHFVYIVDADSHQIAYVNRRTASLLPPVRPGDLCYQAMHGLDVPCEGCPMRRLGAEDAPAAAQAEMHFAGRALWSKVFAAWFDAGARQKYCMIQCVDISAYKEGLS